MAELSRKNRFEDSAEQSGNRASRVFNVLETVIRRSTYVLVALGGLAASLKMLRDMVVVLFQK
jgi:hypothetical protein